MSLRDDSTGGPADGPDKPVAGETANNVRDKRGRFVRGNPGGPGGANRQRSELRRAMEDAMPKEHVVALVRKATRLGLEGDVAAIRLVLEQVCGRAPETPTEQEPLPVELSPLATVSECNAVNDRLIQAISDGLVDPVRAELLLKAIAERRRGIESELFEARLAQLEKALAQAEQNRKGRQ
ncbi:MAG: hypothetical protein U1E73_09490 [Planctomycetota bacterium]